MPIERQDVPVLDKKHQKILLRIAERFAEYVEYTQRGPDEAAWKQVVDLEARAALAEVATVLAAARWPDGVESAIASGLQLNDMEPGALSRELGKILQTLATLDERTQRLENARSTPPHTPGINGSPSEPLEAEAEDFWRKRELAKRAARFFIGVVVGSAIGGTLTAAVHITGWVAEIVKGAISGATGFLAAEASTASDRVIDKRNKRRDGGRPA